MGMHETEAPQTPNADLRDPDNPYGKRDKRLIDSKLAVDWDAVGREYIYGIVSENKKTGQFERHYPSLREVSRRFKIAHPTVGYYARKFNWGDRREKFKEYLRNEFDREVAKARALSAGDVLGVVDKYIDNFRKAIESDAVARASMKDLDVAVRLKAFVQKEVDRSNDATATLNLAQLQARHLKQRDAAKTLSEAEIGFIPSRSDREATALGEGELSSASVTPEPEVPAAPTEDDTDTEVPTNDDEREQRALENRRAAAAKARAAQRAKRGGRGWHSAARSSVLWSQATRSCLAHLDQAERAELAGVLDGKGPKHGGPRARRNAAAREAIYEGARVTT